LLVRRLSSKSSRNKLIFRFNRNRISTSEEKFQEKTNTREKSVRDTSVIKIMRINNVCSTNLLMFCDSENENKNLISSLFVRLKNTKS